MITRSTFSLKLRHTMAVTALLSGVFSAHANQLWGFWAHQRINRMAVFTLPPEMLRFYKTNIEYITLHATDPDKRRYAVEGEAERHFLDCDRYGEYPFDTLPRNWDEAKEKFTEDSLRKHGILPWHLPIEMAKLTAAFRNKDVALILKYSADLGHYVGDAHVPLHTTSNYNGQFSGQRGIHGFWESRLPELFAEKYNYLVGQAWYIEDVENLAWTMVLESHLRVDSVLRFERELNDSFPSDRKFGYESRNSVVMRVYSKEYAAAYHEMLDGMVERRMRQSIRRIGALWFTAWVNAGKPDLNELIGRPAKLKEEKHAPRLRIIDRESNAVGRITPLPSKKSAAILPDVLWKLKVRMA